MSSISRAATSASLLHRARNNESEAWETVVQLYSPLVYKWCKRLGLQANDIDTIGQEVFLSVARKLSDFDHDDSQSSFRGWLRVITRSKVADHHRKKNNELAVGGDANHALFSELESNTEQSESALREESQLLLEQAISIIRNEFSDRDWQMFYRFVGHEASAKLIADEFGVSTNTIYLAKSRIRKRLREYFAGLLDEESFD